MMEVIMMRVKYNRVTWHHNLKRAYHEDNHRYVELVTKGKTEVLAENCPTGTMYTTHIIES
jgi:hypothetical protein